MDARLRVEPWVAELVRGEASAWQIRVAAGSRFRRGRRGPGRGHAIEVRLYAENQFDGFAHRRADHGVGYAGRPRHSVNAGSRPHRPSARIRPAARQADGPRRGPAAPRVARRALDETVVGGVQTDAGFLRWLVDDDAFVRGEYDTGLIGERWGPAGSIEAMCGAGGHCGAVSPPGIGRCTPRRSLGADDGSGSGQGRAPRGTAAISDHGCGSRASALRPATAGGSSSGPGSWRRSARQRLFVPAGPGGGRGQRLGGHDPWPSDPVTVRSWRERVLADAEAPPPPTAGPPLSGQRCPADRGGRSIRRGRGGDGDPLLTVEAMKMQNEVRAPRAGRVMRFGWGPARRSRRRPAASAAVTARTIGGR